MEHYEKQETRYVEDDIDDLPGTLVGGVVHMKVNPGSKIRNLVEYAKRRIKERETKQITWNASGKGTSKAISCAEIFKRLVLPNIKLHQITKLKFKRVEEIWKPKIEGLDVLKVNVDIPAISILLSKEPLDSSEPGYQPPGPFDVYWKGNIEDDKSKNESRKQKSKQRDRSSLGKPEVKFQKRQKPNQDSNRGASSANGKKETKQRSNEKRRASEEGRRNSVKGDGKSKNKTASVKQSVDSSKKETGSDGNGTLHQPVQININVDKLMES